MLLSIVIPAYDRPGELVHALNVFIGQISGVYERDVEIIITDDASPGNSLGPVAALAEKHPFIVFRRRDKNLGLERSLIAAAEGAKGEYLWIFGDDDYLENPDTLAEVIGHLRAGLYDMLVLNRTRRNSDLSNLLSPDWMRLGADDEDFAGLREFCLKFGFISVIGFISVNVFRREAFVKIDPSPFMGTMYPQLGMMVEAFHDKPVRLLARPNVCHRTQTQEEKRAALGEKASEAAFMADADRRNALYFSHPYVNMLDRLVSVGAFEPEDITQIPENTVIHGLLVQFLVDCLKKSEAFPENFSDGQWKRSLLFMGSLPLEPPHRNDVREMARRRFGQSQGDQLLNVAVKTPAVAGGEVKTISVVSPSFNQAEFLDECLQSVANQTFAPIEHLVYDPGSNDGSRDVAKKYKHISLFEESDEGQSDAINKGFRRARGDVVAWLNSDDVFADPTVFERVMRRFNEPDKPDIVYGKGVYIDEHGVPLRDVYLNKKPETLSWRLQQEDGILQPALFMRRSTIEKVGELNGGLHYCMDYEYWIRTIKAGIRWAYIDENFALARYHSSNKTYGQRGKSYAEVCDMLVNHFGYANHVWLRRYAEFLSEGFDGVLAHAANTAVKNEAEIERHYVELLKAYNTSQTVYRMLEQKPSEKGYGDTLRELQRLGIGPSTPCKEVPLDRTSEPGHVCYTVGPKRWAFDAIWKKKQIDKSHAFLRERIAQRDKDVCVIVGNGPSLKKSNLELLQGQDVIISNNAFLEPKLLDCATYYTVVNYLVAEQSSHNINRLTGPAKVLPYWMAYCLNEGDDTYFVDAVGHAAFSKDMFKNMSWRHTVTFYNLHLAFGLGYKRAVMIGFDHFYKQSTDVKEGDVILTNNEDPNHFDSRYFRGKKWQAADVGMMEEMYRLATTAYAEEGREIINATVGGALELFPRMDLADALAMKPAPVVALGAMASSAAASVSKPASAAPAAATAAVAAYEFLREDSASVDETEVIALMLADRRGRNHLMLDVGAHFGGSAAYFEKLDWTIHCFEPDPSNREKLAARFSHAPSVTIDPRAVSDKADKTLPFYTSPQSSGISGLNKFHDTHQEALKVTTTSVSEIIRKQNISNVDFLKIDVEGFDFSVLKGVPWESVKPDVIECEYEDAKTMPLGHTWRDIAEYLQEKGYAVYISEWHPIVRYGVQHDWRRIVPYPDINVPNDSWGNILAFRDDPGFEAVSAAFSTLVKRRKPTPAIVPDRQATTAASPEGSRTVKHAKVASMNNIENQGPASPLDRRSARAASALQFASRAVGGLWRRRIWTVPALLIVAALAVAGVVVDASLRWLFWGAAGFGVVLFALLYLSLRVYQFATTLSAENRRLWASLKQATERINRIQAETVSSHASRLHAQDNAVNSIRAAIDDLTRAQKETASAFHARAEALETGVRQSLAAESEAHEKITKSLQEQLSGALQAQKTLEASLRQESGELNAKINQQSKQIAEVNSNLMAEVVKASESAEAVARTVVKPEISRIARLNERVAASERQIGRLICEDAPQSVVLFGHHKCASRFFRFEVFHRIAEMNDARIRSYKVEDPPFHYSEMDDLDLCNIDFSDFGANGREVVLFANATKRSLNKLRRVTKDWKGLRILRDPRQVLVSNYFHHKGDHETAYNGWIWDKLIHDQPILRELPEAEGLLYELDNISKGIIENQILAPFNDERILTIKLENFAQTPREHLKQIAEFLGAPEIAGLNYGNTGQNPESGPWRKHFTSDVRKIFKERYGQALIDLGYAEDFDW